MSAPAAVQPETETGLPDATAEELVSAVSVKMALALMTLVVERRPANPTDVIKAWVKLATSDVVATVCKECIDSGLESYKAKLAPDAAAVKWDAITNRHTEALFDQAVGMVKLEQSANRADA